MTVTVWWSLGRVFGDCPPVQIAISVLGPKPGVTPMTFQEPTHERTGIFRSGLLEFHADARVVVASVTSADGHQSRHTAVRVTR